MSTHTLQLIIILMALPFTGGYINRMDKEKQHYYCEYCGKKFPAPPPPVPVILTAATKAAINFMKVARSKNTPASIVARNSPTSW